MMKTSSSPENVTNHTGYEFDYVFDWTILKYQQAQKTKSQPRISPLNGANSSRAMPVDVDKNQGGNNVSHSADVTERVISSNAARPGVRMQFKPSTEKNPSTGNNTVSYFPEKVQMPSTSFALPGASKRNAPKPTVPAEAAHFGHGFGSKIGPSSSWLPSLQRNSSAK